jgi:branched-chain amino acid aminotransferase
MPPISAYQITPRGWQSIATQARSADELTRQLPQGFYTTFRTLAGGTKVLDLDSHLKRLYQPAQEQGIRPIISAWDLRAIVGQLASEHSPNESRIRLIMSASDSPGMVYILLEPFRPLKPSVYREGVHVICRPLERATPRLKSTRFIENSQAARQLVQADIFEVLMMRRGRILEGMTSNFFYIKDGNLGTARRDVLLGVTRRTVLRVARGSGLSIVYRPMKREQVQVLHEAFLTSSSRGIVPIVQIDDVTVGEGIPGPITKKLMDGYTSYVMHHTEKIDPR